MAEDGEKPVAPAPIEIEIPSSSSSADDHVPAQVDTNTVADQSPVLTGSVQTHTQVGSCLLYTSPSPRDLSTSRMPSSA